MYAGKILEVYLDSEKSKTVPLNEDLTNPSSARSVNNSTGVQHAE